MRDTGNGRRKRLWVLNDVLCCRTLSMRAKRGLGGVIVPTMLDGVCESSWKKKVEYIMMFLRRMTEL